MNKPPAAANPASPDPDSPSPHPGHHPEAAAAVHHHSGQHLHDADDVVDHPHAHHAHPTHTGMLAKAFGTRGLC